MPRPQAQGDPGRSGAGTALAATGGAPVHAGREEQELHQAAARHVAHAQRPHVDQRLRRPLLALRERREQQLVPGTVERIA
jgi:hypothetical protein